MKITTRLWISAISSIGLVLGLGLVTYLLDQRVERAIEESRAAAELSEAVSQLDILLFDFLLNPGERTREQWQRRHGSIGELLARSREPNSAGQEAVYRNLRENHATLRAVFSQLISNHEEQRLTGRETRLAREIRERLTGQLLISSQEMASGAMQLAESSHEKLEAAGRTDRWSVMGFALVIGALLAATSGVVIRSIVKPIAKLREGTEIIGTGNLDYRISADAKDEIGDLARAFDRMTDQLRNSEQHVRNILDSLFDSLFTLVGLMTPDGILTEANKTALNVAGLKPEDVLGKPFEEAYWWSYSEPIKQQLRQNIERTAQGEAVRYDVVVRVGEDRFITIDFSLQPLFDETGKVTGMVPSAIDITERMRIEEDLRTSELHLRNILNSLFILVGLMTPDGILTEANRTALDVAGLKPEDVLGKPFEETYWWSYSTPIMQQLRQNIERTARGEAVRYDVVVRVGEDRFITIDFGLQPLFDETGRVTGMVPSAIDITERVRVEQKLREYRDRLEEDVADRTAELAVALEQAQESDQLKSQLLSTVSHELRTPLTAIKGFSTAYWTTKTK